MSQYLDILIVQLFLQPLLQRMSAIKNDCIQSVKMIDSNHYSLSIKKK